MNEFRSLVTGPLQEAGMKELAAEAAGATVAPLVVFLQGDLGAGKTTFTRAFILSRGYEGRVKSPTYTLLEIYPLEGWRVVHLDLYRIAHSGELEFLGLDDLHDDRSVFMVEWPDRGAGFLPPADLVIHFEHSGDARSLVFEPLSEVADALCRKIRRFSNILSN